jgi:hypothetical protein
MSDYKTYSSSDTLASMPSLSSVRDRLKLKNTTEPLSMAAKTSNMARDQHSSGQPTPSPTLEQMRQEEMERAKSNQTEAEAYNA